MRYYIVLILLFSMPFVMGKDKDLKVFFSEKQFYSEEAGYYVEIQLQFVGHTVHYNNKKSKNSSRIKIIQSFSQYGEIVAYDKLELKSPPVIDGVAENFHTIQRFALNPGTYEYELEIKEIDSNYDPLVVNRDIFVQTHRNEAFFSDITLAQDIHPTQHDNPTIFSKSGYDVIPMPTNYYPSQMNVMPYYVEMYKFADNFTDSIFVVKQSIVDVETNRTLDHFTSYHRYQSVNFKSIAKAVDITNLPKGKYELKLAVINREKEMLFDKAISFERFKREDLHIGNLEGEALSTLFDKSIPTDSTDYFVSSLIPIAAGSEAKNIIKLLREKNESKNKLYLQSFWNEMSPENPLQTWLSYKEQVEAVEKLYGTSFQVGHETDRGRVYLQYGQPNQISEVPNSPSEYPYEIWQYDKIGNFSNRRFIFYSPTNLTNDYRLLHSDMLGEIQNPRWRYALNKRDTYDKDIDNPDGSGYKDHWGGNSSQYYNSY